MLLSVNGAIAVTVSNSNSAILDAQKTNVHFDKMTQHSQASAATQQQSPEKRIGRFVISETLGIGGFGTVYKAYDTILDREVALKVPHADRIRTSNAAKRFLREAKTAARLTHPHIVQVFDAGQDVDKYFIASRYVHGTSLDELTRKNGAIRPKSAAKIILKLANAVHYAHQQGIIHRDIKPHNVLLDEKGEPHLMDFGLARLETDTEKLTHAGTIMGTPAYMPPEQASSKTNSAVGPRSDQYSLGALFYELLTGSAPFEGPVEVVLFNVQTNEPEPPRKVNAAIPHDLEIICQKAMSKEISHRYPDCASLASDLALWLGDRPITARRIGIVERAFRWLRRNPLIGGLTVAVISVSLVGFIVSASALSHSLSQQKRADEAAQVAIAKADEASKAMIIARQSEEDARSSQIRAQISKEEAERKTRLLDRESTATKTILAYDYFKKGETANCKSTLDEISPDENGFEIKYLRSYFSNSIRKFFKDESNEENHEQINRKESNNKLHPIPSNEHLLAEYLPGGGIAIFDVSDNQLKKKLFTLIGHTSQVLDMEYNDTDGLYTVDRDKKTIYWNMTALKGYLCVRSTIMDQEIPQPSPAGIPVTICTALDINGDKLFISGSQNSIVLNCTEWRQICSIKTGITFAASFDKEANSILTFGNDVFSASTGERNNKIPQTNVNRYTQQAYPFDGNGFVIFSKYNAKYISYSGIDSQNRLLSGFTVNINLFDISAPGLLMNRANNLTTGRFAFVDKYKNLLVYESLPTKLSLIYNERHALSFVTSVSFSNNGRYVLLAGGKGNTSSFLREIAIARENSFPLDSTGVIEVIDLETSTHFELPWTNSSHIIDAKWGDNDSRIAVLDRNQVHIYDFERRLRLCGLSIPENVTAERMEFDPQGRYLLVATKKANHPYLMVFETRPEVWKSIEGSQAGLPFSSNIQNSSNALPSPKWYE